MTRPIDFSAANIYGSRYAKLREEDYIHLLQLAISEDCSDEDVSTMAIFSEKETAEAVILAKNDGIIAGLPVAVHCFRYCDSDLDISSDFHDADHISASQIALMIRGNIQSILRIERIALNFLSMLSGIATHTREIADKAAEMGVKLLDTRKTIPGYRRLSKYAVSCGGGLNHRLNLSSMGMIKDNHIARAGSINGAVKNFRDRYPHIPLELEVDRYEQLEEALNEPPDMFLLDNMNTEEMGRCTGRVREFNAENSSDITCEASGGFSMSNLDRLRGSGVDYVSIGALTNSFRPLDFSLEIR